MSSILFVAAHGYGDLVMLTPALKKYKKLNINDEIYLAVMKRFGNSAIDLLSGLDFINKVLPILPDAWNDFESYEIGIKNIIEQVSGLNGYDKKVFLPCAIKEKDYRLHKIFRFAEEVGVEFDGLTELHTILNVTKEAEEKVESFVEQFDKPILVLHNKAGNPPKEFSKEELSLIIDTNFDGYCILEFGKQTLDKSILIEENDMEFTKALVKRADYIIAIDSLIMHIAGALDKDMLTLFKHTPIHQAIPLFGDVMVGGVENEVTQMNNKYKLDIINKYRKVEKTGRVIVTGPGHTCGNWVTEIIRASGKFNFTDEVEDRNIPFLEGLPDEDVRKLYVLSNLYKMPDNYATKIATDNIGVTKELFDKLFLKYNDLKVVFTIRNPVDTCMSKIFRGTHNEENEPVPDDTINISWDSTVMGSIKSLEYSCSIFEYLVEKYRDRISLVRLEDLITNSERVVDGLCEFLDMKKNEEMFVAYKNSRNKHHKKRYRGKIDNTQLHTHQRWKDIYDNFFIDRLKDISFLFVSLIDVSLRFGYKYNTDYINSCLNADCRLDSNTNAKNIMTYKNLFTFGDYGGRWNINFNIKNGDKVLDIGSGNKPYPFATDSIDYTGEEAEIQRHNKELANVKKLHLGKAEEVLKEFKDNEFDFIYTSHTLEHIDDLPTVLKEISRVGKRGFVIVPHYYLDMLDNGKETGHKWFFDYDHSKNILKIRRRDNEFIEELNNLCHIDNKEFQGHKTSSKIRSLWEIRFYWENGIDFEIDESINEISKFNDEKWITTENPIAIVNTSDNDKYKLGDNYYNPMCYWAHMVTFRCTGNCPFCIVDGRGRHAKFDELSGKEILDWWNNVEHPKGQRLSLIGGETTMHKDIVEVVNNLENYNITITTNCTGPFYQDYYFFNKFKPKSNSTLRINTSFHPHAIEPEDYIGRVRAYRHAGHLVDQVAYVNTPEAWKYQDKINKVSKAFGGIKSPPYLGFYDIKDRFRAPFFKDYLLPNENYPDQEGARNLCGIKDYNWFRTVCGAGVKSEVFCPHGGLSLIIGPNGNYYPCHYKLYYDIDPICNIKDFVSIDGRRLECRHFGYCNWCDIPRLEFGRENLKVSGADKDWLKPVAIEYKNISEEVNRPEIKYVIEDMKKFCEVNNFSIDDTTLFRCASALLYAGQRHRCNTLVIDGPIFASYLKYKGYNVKEEYKEGDEFEFVIVFNDDNDSRKSNLPFLLSKRGCPSVVFSNSNIEIKVKN